MNLLCKRARLLVEDFCKFLRSYGATTLHFKPISKSCFRIKSLKKLKNFQMQWNCLRLKLITQRLNSESCDQDSSAIHTICFRFQSFQVPSFVALAMIPVKIKGWNLENQDTSKIVSNADLQNEKSRPSSWRYYFGTCSELWACTWLILYLLNFPKRKIQPSIYLLLLCIFDFFLK